MRAGGDQIEQRQHQTKSVISVCSDLGDLEAASVCGEMAISCGFSARRNKLNY